MALGRRLDSNRPIQVGKRVVHEVPFCSHVLMHDDSVGLSDPDPEPDGDVVMKEG